MAELRTVHLTDIHDDFEKYQLIAQYIAGKKNSDQAIDAVFITGDFIEGFENREGKTANFVNTKLRQFYDPAVINVIKEKEKQIALLIKEHNVRDDEDFESLDPAIKIKLSDLSGQIGEEHRKACEKLEPSQVEEIVKPFIESYQRHAEELSKLGTPIFGIVGNHDLNLGYDILKNITFLEKTSKSPIKGKTGVEFILKGDINTREFPLFYAILAPLIAKQYIPYISGVSLSELSKEVNQLQAEVANGQSERLEKIAKKETPKYSEDQLKEMTENLEQKIEARKQVLAYNQSERQRLGDKNDEVDIYLTHRLPNCKKARPVDGSLSDVTLDYAGNAKAVYGGHFHDGQVGYKTIENLLKQESTEKTTIDGVEVPVYYLDEKEPWELNPGTKYAFVTEYDTNKEIEQVIIYEFVEYEEAA